MASNKAETTAQVYDLREALLREQANNHPWNSGETWNDADIHGEASEEFDALMSCTAPLIEKDWGKRHMPTRGWRSKAKTWSKWLDDTLTWHREDDRKDGAGYVFGTSANDERKAENMRGMVAIGLDIEPEQPLDDVINRCKASGLAIVLYTSHNHGRITDCEAVDTILKHGGEVTTETVRAYLRSKGAYSEDFISQCILTNSHADIDGKIQAVWSCPPLQKMRAIALFKEPVDVTALDPSPKRGQEVWANKVRGLAQILGVRIDPVATDPSRILYIAKHRPGSDWYCAVFRGRPVQWNDIPEVAKGVDNPFLQAAGGKGGSTIPDVTTSTGIDVTAPYRRYGKRWMLADMLSDSHVAKSEGSDRLHVECPFSDEHTSESGPTSTTVWNAGETERGFAKVLCQHSCKDRYHTVDYVARWIEDGVIEPAWLEDPSFMIGAPDQTGPFEELTPAELEEEQTAQSEQARHFEELAEEIDKTAPWTEIEDFCKRIHAAGADKTAQVNVAAIIAKNTNHTRPDVKAVFKELDGAARKVQAGEGPEGILTTAPAPDQTQYAADAVRTANEKAPFLFEYMEEPTIVRRGRIKSLDRPGKRHALGRVTVFQKPKGEDELQHVYPPYDVVDDLFSSDLSDFCLPLRGAVDTPFFEADGTLVTANGYHAGSQMYLDSDLELDRVNRAPSAEEAHKAARYIVEECLADFPLGGLTRLEIMEQAFTSGVPAVANSLAFILLPFARNMIHGPTPGHIINKPAPGTGAGFLVDVCTTIGSGMPAPALAMPTKSEELAKTLSAALLDGEPVIFFDNINHEMDSAELASAMTAPETGYKTRILGKSQTALVQIMASWAFAANTLTMSSELLRRSILIDLDRKSVDPAKYVPEGGWRHKDVREWTREHRAELVHACLTIIQHWVVEGMQRSEDTLASFENWAGVMGGILKASGVPGFMGNQPELIGLSDGRDDELAGVVQAIADAMHGEESARLYVGSKTDKETMEGKFGLFDILHAMDDTPRLDQWGYAVDRVSGEIRYENTRKAGVRFKAAAKRTYGVKLGGVPYTARFEQEHDTSANAKCYRLELTPA
ncbi:hypothetical protein Q4494_00860 [Celeribacter halophilus]|uniref:Uncharacterized protein n=1 Tax=Celeribacter halophilus TaxID=576117 RepID=A0AAW7XQN3_9RHOB|nr:hypothetical protein [Celeribacter halophilus]MDO6455613.1 hypothetical protein [Celeribacter halophilus]